MTVSPNEHGTGASGSGSEREGPPRLSLFASVIAGRTLDVAAAEPGVPPWTDGATVFVDAGASPEGQRTAVAVQSALLGEGSLEQRVLASLVRRPALARRYLAVEAHHALWARRDILPAGFGRLIDVATATSSDAPDTSLRIARSRTSIAAPPAAFGVIRPGRMITPDGAPTAGGTGMPHDPRSNPTALDELDNDVDDEMATDVFSSPVGGGGGLGKLLKRLLGDARSSETGEPGADAPTRWTRLARPATASGRVVPSRASALDGSFLEISEKAGSTYPEWDSGKRSYKADWCTVLDADPPESVSAPLAVPDVDHLRRALGRLGLEIERYRRQPEGDDLDVDALVEARVDVRAGCTANDAVYVDALRRRDLSALVLLDVSGSAGKPGVNGAPVHQVQRSVAAALTQVLYGLGDRVALYGFRSNGRSAVHVLRVKRFDEVYGDAAMRRLGALTPGAYTRLGAAIRHGTAVLQRDAGTAQRLLIVISDGFAYDHGYERAYGEADSRRALTETRNLGIGCLCLSVGARTDALALRRVFGTAAHAAIDDPRELPPIIGRLFSYALGAAARQRATSRRRIRSAERLRVERTAS